MKPVRITKLRRPRLTRLQSGSNAVKKGSFYERVDEAVEKIERNPEGFQKLYKDMRHVNLEQFKEWGLFFRIRDDGSIVIACISGKRRPSLKQERASGVTPIKPEP
jgi:hypothetical protein